MAVNEVGYQTYLVSGVKAAGGYAEKLSHRFKVGIPDLMLKFPYWEQPKIWEVKLIGPGSQYANGDVKVLTTELQKKTLRDMRQAAMDVGVLLILPGPGRHVRMLLLQDIERDRVTKQELQTWQYMRGLGQDWGQAVWEMVQHVGQGMP